MNLPMKALMFLSIVLMTVNVQATLTNVALQSNGGQASAISEGTYAGTTLYASLAIDGDYLADWASQGDMPAWVQVEFAQDYLIERVGVEIDYHQQTFAISLSLNGSDWTEVVSPRLSENTPLVVPTSESAGASYEVFDITPQLARFMRVDTTTTTAPSSHIFQSIIGEIEAYAIPEPTSFSLLALGGLALKRWRKK